MIIDLLEHPHDDEVEVDVCIVGAGAAGITMAREFCGRPFAVALLEAGGLIHEAESRALYEGESVGLPYGGLEETRVRYFGGSTNAEGWGGWCKPLDAVDFEVRPWAPHSGWPFALHELDHWYARASEVCESGPYDYELESWRREVDVPLGDLRFEGGRVVTQLAQLSPPTRFGRRYRDELKAAFNVRVYLHANVTEIVTDADGVSAERVEARTLDGRRLTIRCGYVVLAAGGVENARLLLVSQGACDAGLGNEHDLVGRFFADHPRIEVGAIDFSGGGLPDLYDPHYKWRRRERTLRGAYHHSLVAGSLAITAETQRRQGLLNYRAWIVSTFPGEGSAAAEAVKRIYMAVRDGQRSVGVGSDLASILRRPDHAAATAFGRFFRPKRLVQSYRLINILEPEQVPESRVTLGNGHDRLGLPRVRLDWRVGRLVRETLASAHEILDEDLRRSGLGRLVDPFRVGEEDRFLANLGWVWHHMGTTRMHADPASGVVDSDCRVHSTSNVYVAGSSVFPTPGNDMPTLTIVALALRLADHLTRRLDQPSM